MMPSKSGSCRCSNSSPPPSNDGAQRALRYDSLCISQPCPLVVLFSPLLPADFWPNTLRSFSLLFSQCNGDFFEQLNEMQLLEQPQLNLCLRNKLIRSSLRCTPVWHWQNKKTSWLLSMFSFPSLFIQPNKTPNQHSLLEQPQARHPVHPADLQAHRGHQPGINTELSAGRACPPCPPQLSASPAPRQPQPHYFGVPAPRGEWGFTLPLLGRLPERTASA